MKLISFWNIREIHQTNKKQTLGRVWAGWGPGLCARPCGWCLPVASAGTAQGEHAVPAGGSPSGALSRDLQASSSRQDSMTLPTSGPSPSWSDCQTPAPSAPEAESSYPAQPRDTSPKGSGARNQDLPPSVPWPAPPSPAGSLRGLQVADVGRGATWEPHGGPRWSPD